VSDSPLVKTSLQKRETPNTAYLREILDATGLFSSLFDTTWRFVYYIKRKRLV